VGKQRTLIGQAVPPTPFGVAFGRIKLSPQVLAAATSGPVLPTSSKGFLPDQLKNSAADEKKFGRTPSFL
jgi:hypothetical protein